MRRERAAGAVLALLAATPAVGAPPMRSQEPSVVTNARAKYSVVQEGHAVGHEWVTRRVFDNNTIQFEAEDVIRNPAVVMTTRSELTIEEESHFPRSYRAAKTITQPSDEIVHTVTVDMFANVAVLGSEMRGTKDSRRVVVPAGIAVFEVGMVYPWYQILFWIDPAGEGRQRIEWLNPTSGAVETGEMYVAGRETIEVLGKQTRVTVYKAERERLGPATLYVDEKKRIVRAEQNMLIYRLEEWTEEIAKR